MAQDNSETTFHVGDSDLRFLGLAVVLAARFQARRKGSRVRLANFPQSEADALHLVEIGMTLAETIPLDDVPAIRISVTGDKARIHALLALIREDEAAATDADELDDDTEDNYGTH